MKKNNFFDTSNEIQKEMRKKSLSLYEHYEAKTMMVNYFFIIFASNLKDEERKKLLSQTQSGRKRNGMIMSKAHKNIFYFHRFPCSWCQWTFPESARHEIKETEQCFSFFIIPLEAIR